jgi:hypothetical protein
MCIHQSFGDREPDAHPTVFAGGVWLYLIEFGKDLLQLARQDANAIILHPDQYFTAGLEGCSEGYLSKFGGKAYRILEQVDKGGF